MYMHCSQYIISCWFFFVCLFQDYVLQPDGSVTPVCKVQNLVLDEQRAGEILTLAQVLTDHLL